VLSSLLIWVGDNARLAGTIAGISALVTLIYLVVIYIFILNISPDYFLSRRPSEGTWRSRHPLVRITLRVLKNALGVVFVGLGLALLLLPGQGLITVLIGISLLEFPGKRRLELSIIRRRPVLKAVNWFRTRAGRPPLRVDGVDA
jgi:hypothetical protein